MCSFNLGFAATLFKAPVRRTGGMRPLWIAWTTDFWGAKIL